MSDDMQLFEEDSFRRTYSLCVIRYCVIGLFIIVENELMRVSIILFK